MLGRWLIALLVGASGCDRVLLDERSCLLDDEDCDHKRNSVDPCPADPRVAEDEDADHIGDTCDPNPTTAVDALVEFDGFTAPNPFWTFQGGAIWTIEGGVFAQPELANGSTERPVPPNRQPTVEVVIDPVFGDDPMVPSSVAVFVKSKASTGIPLECRVVHHEAGDELVMFVGTIEIGRATGLDRKPGERLRIYGGQLPDFKIRCRARYGDTDSIYVDWGFGSVADFDTIGLRTEQAGAEFRSVTIYTTLER